MWLVPPGDIAQDEERKLGVGQIWDQNWEMPSADAQAAVSLQAVGVGKCERKNSASYRTCTHFLPS